MANFGKNAIFFVTYSGCVTESIATLEYAGKSGIQPTLSFLSVVLAGAVNKCSIIIVLLSFSVNIRTMSVFLNNIHISMVSLFN